MAIYHYVVYEGKYAIYDTLKLTVKYDDIIIRLDDILLMYNGVYVNSRGICFVLLDRKLNLYLFNTDIGGTLLIYKIHDLPSALYATYYQCIVTIGNVNTCYDSQKQHSFQITLPDEPMCITSHHIMYVKDSIISSIPLRKSDLFKPMNLLCPYDVKRLYPYNMGCIIRTTEDKYYICPYNRVGYVINIMGKTFNVTDYYVHINNLDSIDVHDIGYFRILYVYDGKCTYYDKHVIDGHYNIQLYISDDRSNVSSYRLHYVHDNIKIKTWTKSFHGFEDMIICIE